MLDDLGNMVNKVLNLLSATVVVGTIVGVLPFIFGFIGAVYYLMQLYECRTVQTWLATRRSRKIAAYKKAMARLQAQDLKHRAFLHAGNDPAPGEE